MMDNWNVEYLDDLMDWIPSTSRDGGKPLPYKTDETIGINQGINHEGDAIPEQKDLDNTLVLRLMEIFPQACPRYIRKVCINKTWREFDDLVTEILSNEDYPKRPEREPSPPKEVDPDEQFEIMKEFLPDADPNYLQMKCQEYINDVAGLNEFVNNARQTKDYPTLEEYLRKRRLSAQSSQYTTAFNVENFVRLFPNPQGTFEDPNRAIELDDCDKMYIKMFFHNRYNHVRKRSINWILNFEQYKILASEMRLKKCKDAMKSRRRILDSPYLGGNVLILQELAYINHQEEIEEFIRKKLEKEKQDFENAKAKGLLNECQCCFDKIMEKNTIECQNGCKVCRECVIKSCEVNFGEGKLEFQCLNGCLLGYSLRVLQKVLPPKMFSKIALKKSLAEVEAAGIEDLEACPFCDFASIPGKNDKIFCCLNPDCMKESCRSCKEPNHIPLRCDEVERDAEVKTRVFIENRMTEALLRTCWKCNTRFFKEEGCNRMTCTCGASMCYLCKQPVTDYKHFNGIGGDKYHLCPLYSDTNQINMENVLEAAEAAKAEVGSSALLKIDPSADVAMHYADQAKKKPRQPYLEDIAHAAAAPPHLLVNLARQFHVQPNPW